jgi:anti-sigma factor RsiW
VNTETRQRDETLWAYLHGELDEDARRIFEQRLAADGVLRDRCEHARRLDRLLQATLPELDAATACSSDEALTDQALAAWEQDQPSVPGDPAALHARRPAAPCFRLFRPLPVGIAGLAAAVLLVVAVHPLFRDRQEPREAAWADAEFVPLVYRGQAPAPGSGALGPRDAVNMQAALADALAWALDDRNSTLPAGMTLFFRVQQLPAGAFSVAVRAEGPDGAARGEWNGDYSRRERFYEQADASAAQIAEALALPRAEAGPSRRRAAE